MARCRDGDLDAFRRLVERHQQRLVNFFHRMGVGTYSQDLTQETFLRIFRHRHRYKELARWTTYLYTVARNLCFDHLRRQRRRQTVMERLAGEQTAAAPDPRRVPAPPATGLELAAALDRLSPKLRVVVVLAFFEGQDYPAIARILRIPEGTVKSRMYLAIRALRHHFAEAENDENTANPMSGGVSPGPDH